MKTKLFLLITFAKLNNTFTNGNNNPKKSQKTIAEPSRYLTHKPYTLVIFPKE